MIERFGHRFADHTSACSSLRPRRGGFPCSRLLDGLLHQLARDQRVRIQRHFEHTRHVRFPEQFESMLPAPIDTRARKKGRTALSHVTRCAMPNKPGGTSLATNEMQMKRQGEIK